jgi:hypothetical protein
MLDKEIETLAELVAIKAAKQAIKEAKEEWSRDIALHSADCEAKKFKGIKNLASAGVGGIIVLVFNWLVNKLKGD